MSLLLFSKDIAFYINNLILFTVFYSGRYSVVWSIIRRINIYSLVFLVSKLAVLKQSELPIIVREQISIGSICKQVCSIVSLQCYCKNIG